MSLLRSFGRFCLVFYKHGGAPKQTWALVNYAIGQKEFNAKAPGRKDAKGIWMGIAVEMFKAVWQVQRVAARAERRVLPSWEMRACLEERIVIDVMSLLAELGHGWCFDRFDLGVESWEWVVDSLPNVLKAWSLLNLLFDTKFRGSAANLLGEWLFHPCGNKPRLDNRGLGF